MVLQLSQVLPLATIKQLIFPHSAHHCQDRAGSYICIYIMLNHVYNLKVPYAHIGSLAQPPAQITPQEIKGNLPQHVRVRAFLPAVQEAWSNDKTTLSCTGKNPCLFLASTWHHHRYEDEIASRSRKVRRSQEEDWRRTPISPMLICVPIAT